MSCILTVLTVLSVFNGNQWNDIEVSTISKLTNMNEQISSKVEFLSENMMKTETTTVKCGEDIYSVTTSTLLKE
jgi:hypothetical protein